MNKKIVDVHLRDIGHLPADEIRQGDDQIENVRICDVSDLGAEDSGHANK